MGLSGNFLFNFSELLTIMSHWYFRHHLTERQTGKKPRELSVELVKSDLFQSEDLLNAAHSRTLHCPDFFMLALFPLQNLHGFFSDSTSFHILMTMLFKKGHFESKYCIC